MLASMIAKGAKVRSTRITEEFDFEAYNASQNDGAVNLFALNQSGRLRVFGGEPAVMPEAGWTVISLGMPREDQPENGDRHADEEDENE